jgi:hypothetical protein
MPYFSLCGAHLSRPSTVAASMLNSFIKISPTCTHTSVRTANSPTSLNQNGHRSRTVTPRASGSNGGQHLLIWKLTKVRCGAHNGCCTILFAQKAVHRIFPESLHILPERHCEALATWVTEPFMHDARVTMIQLMYAMTTLLCSSRGCQGGAPEMLRNIF